jgi:hypothetical protein
MKTLSLNALAIAALLTGACASAPKPTNELANAQAAVRAAREVGAESKPQAQLHLVLAEEQLEKANKLMENGDEAQAASMLTRAKADAELAVALTHSANAKRALEQSSSAEPSAAVSMNTSK